MIGEPSDVVALVARYGVSRVVVAVADRRGKLPVAELMHVKLSGVKVEEAATTYERLTGKLMLENLTPSSLIFSDGFGVLALAAPVKRAADILLSSRRPRAGRRPHGVHGTHRVARIRPANHLPAGTRRPARAALHLSSSSARCESTPKATCRLGGRG